jgi:hypothetical protein
VTWQRDTAPIGPTRRKAANFNVCGKPTGVLSDPAKRQLYDHELEENQIRGQTIPEPKLAQPQSRSEPLTDAPMSVLRDFKNIRPAFEPLFERWVRNFTGENIPKGERLEALNVEVIFQPRKLREASLCRWVFPCFMIVPSVAAPDVIGSSHV